MTNTQRTDEQKTNPKPCKVGHCDGMCYCTESKPILTDESVVDIAEKIEEMYQSGKYDADFRKKLIVNTLTSQSTKHKAEVEEAVMRVREEEANEYNKIIEREVEKARKEERERIAVRVWGLWGQKPDHMEDTERSRTFSEVINFIRSLTNKES